MNDQELRKFVKSLRSSIVFCAPEALEGLLFDKLRLVVSKRLQGERWEPVIADEKHEQEGKEILIENQGEWVGIRRIGVEGRDAWHGVWLNELGCVVMRKVAADEGEREWPPASTAIVSEYEAALRPDDMPSFPTCEQMVTALRAQGYVVLTNADTDTLRYVGGECPTCHQQVQP